MVFVSTSAVSTHSGRQATLVWSTLRYRAQCPETAQTKTMTLVSGRLQIQSKALRRLPNCSSPAPPFRVPMPVALSWPRCFSIFRRTRHTIIRNTDSTVVLKKQQIIKTTTRAFSSFNSFSQPWQSPVEIKVLKQGAVLHVQKVTLTCNVSPNLAPHSVRLACPSSSVPFLTLETNLLSCSHFFAAKPCSAHFLLSINHLLICFPELISRQPPGPRSLQSKVAPTRSLDIPGQLPEVPRHALLALFLRVMPTVRLLFS